MKTQIVLGSLFGDEGKGNTVQWLCKESIARGEKPLVIRFSGGAQAGHRVIHNGVEHVCSLFGSGVLLGCDTYLDSQVFVDPVSLRNELHILGYKLAPLPKIYVHPNCRVVLPSDILCNRKNKETIEHGTCGCGIFECYKRSIKESIESLNDDFYSCLQHPEEYLRDRYPECEELKEADKEFIEACNWLNIFLNWSSLQQLEDQYDSFIFEGSQGLGLDMECGYMPHCTPSKVGLNGIEARYLQDAEVYLVMRTYLTRHGNGYDPDNDGMAEFKLEEPTNLDTGIQGKFKVGYLDLNLLKDLISRHHLDNYEYKYNCNFNFVFTHMDCIKKGEFFTVLYEYHYSHVNVHEMVFLLLQNDPLFKLSINKVFGGYSPESDIREI